MESMSETASFLATIPAIQSALRTGGDGMRVQFDVPETEMGEAIQLVLMRGKRLRVTVEVVDDEERKARKI